MVYFQPGNKPIHFPVFQHLIERSWYAVTETCLAFTVFRDDFSPRFVAQFTLLLFLKCFHWLAEDRIDYMERSPVLSWVFHVRAVLLLMFLGMVDAVLVHIAYNTTMQSGASVQLVFGFEVKPVTHSSTEISLFIFSLYYNQPSSHMTSFSENEINIQIPLCNVWHLNGILKTLNISQEIFPKRCIT